jgi:pantoate kinase
MSALITPNETKRAKEPRISKRMQQVIALLASKGITQREAAKQVGMSEFHLSRELKKPQIRVFMERAARQAIAMGVLRASSRVMELVDAGSEHVSLDASKHVLGIAGIKPSQDAQVSVNIDIKAGYVIDLSEGQSHRSTDQIGSLLTQQAPLIIDNDEIST